MMQRTSQLHSFAPSAFCGRPRKRRCLGLKTYAAASQLKTEAESWFDSAGINCSKAKLTTLNGLRGMIATEDIPAGDIFASVPHDSALVLQPAKKCPFPEFCSAEYWKKTPWFVRLGLMILHEKHIHRDQSRFVHYIEDLMAIKIETPLVWSQSEVKALQYPWLEEQIKKQTSHWTALYETFQKEARCNVDIGKDEFFWALQAVRSRAFSGPYGGPPLKKRATLAAALVFAGYWSLQIAHVPTEQVLNAGIAAVLFNIIYDVLMSKKLKRYAMLPAIDYINHSATIESDISYEIFSDSFTVSTNAAFSKGEEVKVSYGRHNNDYLLQFFGFFIGDLPYDSYTIWTEGQTLDDGTELPKQIVLTRRGLSTATLEWKKQCQNPKQAQKAILQACMDEQSNWKTTIAEDQKQARFNVDDRESMAVAFRLEKKKLLQDSIKALSK